MNTRQTFVGARSAPQTVAQGARSSARAAMTDRSKKTLARASLPLSLPRMLTNNELFALKTCLVRGLMRGTDCITINQIFEVYLHSHPHTPVDGEAAIYTSTIHQRYNDPVWSLLPPV
eukprot:7380184-Prymnesium_polylepis.2